MPTGSCAEMATYFRGSIVASISACHADDLGSIPGRGEVGTIEHVSGAASPRSMVNTELACMCTRIQNPHGCCICAFGAWHAHPHGKLATAKSSSVGSLL